MTDIYFVSRVDENSYQVTFLGEVKGSFSGPDADLCAQNFADQENKKLEGKIS